jgi:hypothetical protein
MGQGRTAREETRRRGYLRSGSPQTHRMRCRFFDVRDELLTPASASYQQGLQHTVSSHRLHEVGGRTVVTVPSNRVDDAHIEMPDGCAKQRRIQFFHVMGISPHPESRGAGLHEGGVGSPIWLSKPVSISDINGSTENRVAAGTSRRSAGVTSGSARSIHCCSLVLGATAKVKLTKPLYQP